MVALNALLDRTAARTPPLWADVPSFTAFAQEVEGSLIGDSLPYAERAKLIARAGHFGIRRFDANLIIAMVQHRAGESRPEGELPARNSWLVPVGIGLFIQSIIIVAVVIIFRSPA